MLTNKLVPIPSIVNNLVIYYINTPYPLYKCRLI